MSPVSREEFETQQKKIKSLEKKIKKLTSGDSAAPKRLSGYNVFLSEKSKSKDYEDVAKSERFGKISAEWNKLTDSDKDEYKTKATKINEKALKASKK